MTLPLPRAGIWGLGWAVPASFALGSRRFGANRPICRASHLLHSRCAFGIALPVAGASCRRQFLKGCGCSSVVEHDLAKVGVEGSSPFARSNLLKDLEAKTFPARGNRCCLG